MLVLQITMPGQEVLWTRHNATTYSHGILIDKSQFRPDVIQSLATNFVESHKEQLVYELMIYTNRHQAVHHDRASNSTYDGWLSTFKLLMSIGSDAAQVIGFNGSSVLRTRDGQTVTTRLLSGDSDPLVWNVSGKRFVIVHVAITDVGIFPVKVFAKALQRVDQAGVETLFDRMNERLNGVVSHLSVREDSWFAAEVGFPVGFPFDVAGPPTVEEWDRLPVVRCGNYPQGKVCRAFNVK